MAAIDLLQYLMIVLLGALLVLSSLTKRRKGMRFKNWSGLTHGEKFILKWQFNIGSDFERALIKLITVADDENRDRICKGFPLEVDAFEDYSGTPGWWGDLLHRAGVEDGA